MLVFQILIAVVIAPYVCLASTERFQPGSDYDAYLTANLCNCTGVTPVSNVTVRNAFDTLPQIDPSSLNGWEQWTLSLHGSPQLVLRWSKGDQSSSEPSSSHVDILIYVNGTVVQGTVGGNLSYTNGESIKQISIGNNTLTWDTAALWFNASVSYDGYQIQMNSYSATMDSFHPNVAFHNGLLDQAGEWFGSVPLIRGHVTGSFVSPTAGSVDLDGLSAMKHIFSEKPLPTYINKYSGGTIFGYSTTFYDTHVFYSVETTNETNHEAAFLGRAIPVPGSTSVFSSAWATYAVTDDDELYSLDIDSSGSDSDGNIIGASFSGCANTNDVSYLFNVTALTLLGEFTDAAGGVTTYYSVQNGTTSAEFDGAIVHGSIAGFFEEYVAPSDTGA